MVKLKKGRYSKEPVQTPFGWHVIQVEEIRTQKAPPLEEVKAQLANELRQKKLAEYITKLRESAKIELAGAKEEAAGKAKK
jgi:peptidyl-prolyl cis-trans isomerase C